MTEPSHAVFLSHASQDAEAAQKICAALRAAGIQVFFDQSELRGGDVWDQRIRREIDDCALFIPIVSRHTQERLEGYFRHEWKLAIERTHHMAEQKAFLVPVVVDGTGDREAIVPDLFRAVQWTRLPAGETPPAFVERVQRLLSLEGSTPIRRPAAAQSSAVGAIRTPVQASWSLQRGLLVVVAVVLAGVVAYLAIDELWISKHLKQSVPITSAASVTSARAGSTSVSVPPPHSIAVLAFSDLSAEGNQGYFADGIAEEILNVLAHVNGLKVASRTSSFQFRKSDLGATAIAQKLGVRHVLEGSVRKAGDTVRITAQLIDASTDQHEWSQSFDRPLSTANLFAIQDEIAQSIVTHLAATMGGAVDIAMPAARRADTADEDAYDLYLKGRALFMARTKQNLRAAIAPLKAAVAKDPRFARAWEMLGAVLVTGKSWDVTDPKEPQAGANAIDTALRLDPNLSLAYAVRGEAQLDTIPSRGAVGWDDSNDSYSRAIERDATDATAYAFRAQNYTSLGYFDRAIAGYQRCQDIDPAYELCRRFLAMTYLYLGRTDDALRLLEIGLGNGYLFTDVAFVTAVAARGDRFGALDILARQYEDDPQLIRPLYRALTDRTFNDRDRQNAVALVNRSRNSLTFVPSALLVLKAYEEITSSDMSPAIWWARDDAWLKSQSRKRLMRSWHLPEYWAKHGFPPQCRPVGETDFECR